MNAGDVMLWALAALVVVVCLAGIIAVVDGTIRRLRGLPPRPRRERTLRPVERTRPPR